MSTITGTADAVRVRIMDDWPERTGLEFFSILGAAKYGRRPASVVDDQRMGEEFARAPIAPVEDIGSTVSAQLQAIAGDDR